MVMCAYCIIKNMYVNNRRNLCEMSASHRVSLYEKCISLLVDRNTVTARILHITTMCADWRVKNTVFSTKPESSRNYGSSPAMAREESRE